MTTMGEVKRAHASAGGHFFDPATMRLFKSRVVSARLYDGGFLVEPYGDHAVVTVTDSGMRKIVDAARAAMRNGD